MRKRLARGGVVAQKERDQKERDFLILERSAVEKQLKQQKSTDDQINSHPRHAQALDPIHTPTHI